jgi:hypothetical protein
MKFEDDGLIIMTITEGRDPLTMDYVDNIDNRSSNEYEKK